MVDKNNINNQWQEISKMYPYGEFPTQYTKKCKEADINNPNIFNYHNIQTKDNNISTLSSPPEDRGNLEMSKLIPILAKMKDKKEMKTQDMLNLILPLLLGSKSKDINSLLKLLGSGEKKVESQQLAERSTPIKTPQYPPIDSLKRIDG